MSPPNNDIIHSRLREIENAPLCNNNNMHISRVSCNVNIIWTCKMVCASFSRLAWFSALMANYSNVCRIIKQPIRFDWSQLLLLLLFVISCSSIFAQHFEREYYSFLVRSPWSLYLRRDSPISFRKFVAKCIILPARTVNEIENARKFPSTKPNYFFSQKL